MVWILPTLDRPAQCRAVLEQITAMGGNSPGVVYVNGDKDGYLSALYDGQREILPERWTTFFARENLGALGALNKVFRLYPDEAWYGFVGDDEFVLTPGFDKKLIAAAGDWDFSHGDDGVNNGKRAQGYLCIGGKLAKAVGYLALPECWHWYGLDDMWEALARTGICKQVFVDEVKVDHRHPLHGKGRMDECYELGRLNRDLDYQVYCHWLRHGLAQAVARIETERRDDGASATD